MIDALYAFSALLTLILLGMPIALAMLIVGFVGFGLMIGWEQSFFMIGQTAYDTGFNYELIVLPLFVLMGNMITRAGFSDALYALSYSFLGHLRGGLAMATLVACGGFSAISGSSLATAATMAKVAVPPMRRYGYADSLALGSVAAGGTLGIMIPPSVIMVIFGLITETNIGKLFVAGIVPGALGLLGYCLAAWLVALIDPKRGPRGERSSWRSRGRALLGVWGVILLFLFVVGGIYGGVFTTVEAAGMGASGAFLIALMRRRLSLSTLLSVLVESARTTAMLFAILIGALAFSNVINLSGVAPELVEMVEAFALPPILVVAFILLVYIVLGCVLESISMILLTVPVFFPVVAALGYDPLWFGVLVVMVTEIGLISPPVGLNIAVLRSVHPEVPIGQVFRGVIPFLCADFVRLVALTLLPALALTLPRWMG